MTHLKRLKDVEEEADYFFRTVTVLGKKLGTVLFQFPAYFRANRPRLEDFLRLIPETVACAFEFRSPTWLEAGIPELLAGSGHALCTADADDAPAEEILGKAPWGYLRLRRSDYTEGDLSRWAERVRGQPWERAFVFFKHEDEAKGPGEALRFRELASSLPGREARVGPSAPSRG